MEAAGVDVLLVGDTAAEVVLGLDTTRDVPVDFLLAITAAVRRGAPQTYVMADLPYEWRRGGVGEVVEGARRFRDETGSDAVKIELTGEDVGLIEAVRAAGVDVVAHIGLLPQAIAPGEPYRACGRTAEAARDVIETARRCEAAGASMLLLEAVASEVAREVVTHSNLPVIGCVAGPHCDGTVVVLHDMIGWGGGHKPRKVKQYGDLSSFFHEAFDAYMGDIRAERFPGENDAIHMRPGEYDKLMSLSERQ